MLRSALLLSLGLSAFTACGGAAAPLAEDEATLSRRAIPLGSYARIRSTDARRTLERLTLETPTRFTAELRLQGRSPGFWTPAPDETKHVSGTYEFSRARPAYVDPDQRVRDAITLRYEDATYAYDHFTFEWRAPALVLTNGRDETVLQSDASHRAEAPDEPIRAHCTSDGSATVSLVLDENQHDKGTLRLVQNGATGFPRSQSVAVTKDTMTVGRDPAIFRGMRGEQGFEIGVPRRILGGANAAFRSSLTWESDQAGDAKSFPLACTSSP